MNEQLSIAEEALAQEKRRVQDAMKEAALIPCVREALERAEALDPDDLSQAVAADKATSSSSWSARDYVAQRLATIRGLQQVIDSKKMLGKATAEFETSLRAESDRLARFLLRKNEWPEPDKEQLPSK
ncbi:MAG: hypothetical protein AAB429_01560 [Patescibacteria group bacterium]